MTVISKAGVVQKVGLGKLTLEDAAQQGQAAPEKLCGESCLLQQG
jgi:hypothetical protein